MTAYSFKTHATRDKIAGDRTPLITIQHGHPTNNEHSAPFESGLTAAPALLVHSTRQLSDPQRGADDFIRPRTEIEQRTNQDQRHRPPIPQPTPRPTPPLAHQP